MPAPNKTILTTPPVRLLTTGEVLGTYLSIDGLAALFRYLLFPMLLPDRTYEAYLTGIALQLSLALVLTVLAISRSIVFSALSFRLSPRDFVIALFFGIVGANSSLFVASWSTTVQEQAPSLFRLLFIGILTPLLEEVLFRGVVFESLSRRYTIVVPMLISSVAFASFHVYFWVGLEGGIELTLAYLACRRSLTASIIAHMTVNLIVNLPGNKFLYTHYLSH